MHDLTRAPERVLPLVPGADSAGHMAFVHSVIEGAMGGLVLANAASEPRSAFVATYSGFFFALGQADTEFAAECIPVLQRWQAAEPAALWAVTPGWTATLAAMFPKTARRSRHEFLPPLSTPPETELPAGCSITTDAAEVVALYRDALQADTGQAGETWLADAWGGAEAFVSKSFGCGIVRDGTLIAMCAACAIAKISNPPEAEVEIWTAAHARRAGLALRTAAAFIRQCHERGMQPAWTCETVNQPSRQLASRLGFRFLRQIEGYVLTDYTG